MSFLHCHPYDKTLPFWKQVIGGAFCVHWFYGLVTGFFLGQAFLLVLLIAAAIAKVIKP